MSDEEITILYKKYYKTMYYYLAKTVSFAFVNDAIVDIFLNIQKDPRSIADYPSMPNYLFKCVQNKRIDLSRARKCKEYDRTYSWYNDKYFESHMEPYEMQLNCMIEEDKRYKQALELTKEIISTLPARMGQVIEMSIVEGIPHKEICKILGIAPRTLLNTKHRALKLVKDQLEALK
jgi:RNA polymerase sigma factor (sigma-70 family)